MSYPVIDLHCDLLSYLAGHPSATPLDPQARCSIPQMQAGRVRLQTLAIGYETKPGSAALGLRQAECFAAIVRDYADSVQKLKSSNFLHEDKISLVTAIENASAFCEEGENLVSSLERFEEIVQLSGNPLYISLTWNHENRFGGGALTSVGLKPDGKTLLEFLDGRHIAVDLSHTSDQLAHDILDYIRAKNLAISILASHSNARAVTHLPRNLPNELIQEVFICGGIIGLNFVRKFVGSDSSYFVKHIETFFELGGIDSLCLGADYFVGDDWFFPEFQDSSCYPRLFEILGLSHETLLKLANVNAKKFLERLWGPAFQERLLVSAPSSL